MSADGGHGSPIATSGSRGASSPVPNTRSRTPACRGAPKIYNGQRFTVRAHSFTTIATIGLERYGLGDTKLIVGGGYSFTTFDPNGRNSVTMKALSLYHSFAGGAVEVKAGYMQNYVEYAGLLSGGNPALTTGLVSLIPIQSGLSGEPTATPAANIQFNVKSGAYAKFGIQRSMSPKGLAEEVRQNGIGLNFSVPGAKALYIGELGFRRAGTATQRSFWLRAGALYNTSDYTRWLGGTGSNAAYYALLDLQVTRPDAVQFFRGLYLGTTLAAAPKSVSTLTRAAELRGYYIGPFSARPSDAINVTLNYNRYSDDLRDKFLIDSGRSARKGQATAAMIYSVHVAPGLRIAPGLSYVVNPSYQPQYKGVLGGSFGINITF